MTISATIGSIAIFLVISIGIASAITALAKLFKKRKGDK